MADIEQIKRQIEKLYKAVKVQPVVDVPPKQQVMQWAWFAKGYIAAASIVRKEAPQHLLPILQMTGQAIESSLKACLAAADSSPPIGHDLVELYQLAEELGFQLDDSDKAALIHLNHFYFRDLATNIKHKARYPTNTSERLGGSVPKDATFVSIIGSLIEQAEKRIDGDEPNG